MNIFRTRPSGRVTNQRVLAVEDGQVLCPRRGVADIEGCWVCPAYLGMSGETMDGVICSTQTRRHAIQAGLEHRLGRHAVGPSGRALTRDSSALGRQGEMR